MPCIILSRMSQKTDMKAVALQMALDIMHEKEQRDLVTGLKSRIRVANESSAMFSQL